MLRVQSAKCLFCGRSSEASSSSPWHGSRVMPGRYSVGLGPRNPLGMWSMWCGWFLEIGRRVQYVSGPSTSCGCGAYGRRSSGFWVSCTSRICVCRRLQSFGEASRLPRVAVACRSVYGRRSCAGISQRLSHPQQSL